MSPTNTRSTCHLQTIMIFLASCLLFQSSATAKSVFTFKKLTDQIGQLVTSSALSWESYSNDPKQLDYAVRGGEYMTDEQHYPIYVCRALVDGIYTSGHTDWREQTTVCKVSMLMEVRTHHAFDLLINKGHAAKLTWKPWSKFSGGTPNGAISATSTNADDAYVARHRVKNENHHHHHAGGEHKGPDYYLGRFDPRDRLGKIIVSEDRRELDYEEGEILIETEPVRYELREIKIDQIRMDAKINTTQLGTAILSNPGRVEALVETVISYEYDKMQYWGTYDGFARGLPTKVYEQNIPPSEIEWGLKLFEKKIETKTVSTNLKPGTALNVTLNGNYTSMEAPYSATLIAYYADNDDSRSRKINTYVQKADLHDIKLDFSPIYWIENGTLYVSSTTTTTTTTEPTTTSTKEPKPVYSPPVVRTQDLSSSSSSSLSSSSSSSSGGSKKDLGEEDDMMSPNNDIAADESREAPLRNHEQQKSEPSSATSLIAIGRQFSLVTILGTSCLLIASCN